MQHASRKVIRFSFFSRSIRRRAGTLIAIVMTTTRIHTRTCQRSSIRMSFQHMSIARDFTVMETMKIVTSTVMLSKERAIITSKTTPLMRSWRSNVKIAQRSLPPSNFLFRARRARHNWEDEKSIILKNINLKIYKYKKLLFLSPILREQRTFTLVLPYKKQFI